MQNTVTPATTFDDANNTVCSFFFFFFLEKEIESQQSEVLTQKAGIQQSPDSSPGSSHSNYTHCVPAMTVS